MYTVKDILYLGQKSMAFLVFFIILFCFISRLTTGIIIVYNY